MFLWFVDNVWMMFTNTNPVFSRRGLQFNVFQPIAAGGYLYVLICLDFSPSASERCLPYNSFKYSVWRRAVFWPTTGRSEQVINHKGFTVACHIFYSVTHKGSACCVRGAPFSVIGVRMLMAGVPALKLWFLQFSTFAVATSRVKALTSPRGVFYSPLYRCGDFRSLWDPCLFRIN